MKVHNATNFKCNKCDEQFRTVQTLKRHQKHAHEKKLQCNDCSFKAETWNQLDDHIAECHPPKQTRRPFIYSKEQRFANGPCRSWNRGNCRHEDLCKYEHVEICFYEENCKFGSRCWYRHTNKIFLGGTRKPTFQYREEEFPTPRASRM